MADRPTVRRAENGERLGIDRLAVFGVLAGGAVLVGSMLALAALAIGFGWIRRDETGVLNLGPWLMMEVVGGAAASVAAGWVCRRIAGRFRGPVILAMLAGSLGLLEAAEILRHFKGNSIGAPFGLVLCAPLVAAIGILIGGFRRSAGDADVLMRVRMIRVSALGVCAIPISVLIAATLLAVFGLPGHETGATVVASALALDFTVVVPALVYVLLVRARRVPWVVIVPTAALGYVIALFVIPAEHHGALEYLRLLAIPVEIAVVAYLLVQVRRAYVATPQSGGDFATRLRTAAVGLLGNRIAAGIVTTEVAILYHAFGWGASPLAARSFTVHRACGYGTVLIGLYVAFVAETFVLHLVVSQWSGVAAWVLTGLNVYAGVWCLGDYRAFAARPILVTPTEMHVRVGLRWEVSVGLESIEEVRAKRPPAEMRGEAHTAVVLGEPNLCVRLRHPVEVQGMYGLRRTAREIWLQVDEAERLCSEVRAGVDPSRASREK